MKKYILLLIILIVPFTVFGGAKLIKGDLNTPGSIVKIGDEKFYVMGKTDDTHVRLLSMYNLGMGNFIDGVTYRQNPYATGSVDNASNPSIGSVIIGYNRYPSSTMKAESERYAEYINTLGVNVTARVVKTSEFNEFVGNTYMPGRAWMYRTSYAGVPDNYEQAPGIMIYASGSYTVLMYMYDSGCCGIRPLLEMEVTGELEREEEEPAKSIKPKLTNSQYHLGDTYTIGDQEFYIIGKSDESHLKLLSKYNLGFGTGYSTPTNKQESGATGWVEGESTANGGSSFGSNYWYTRNEVSTLRSEYGNSYPAYVYTTKKEDGSYINRMADPINNYVEYLKTFNVDVTGRLIKHEELVGLGCDALNGNCNSAPSWLYSTSYWTGSADYAALAYAVASNGYFGEEYYGKTYYGVRPVIELNIDYEEIVPEDLDEPKEEKKDKKKKSNGIKGVVEEIMENPYTGIASLSFVLILALCGFIVYMKLNKKSFFKH